jgi:glycosyltransferase involved in cell wall biosynthesis
VFYDFASYPSLTTIPPQGDFSFSVDEESNVRKLMTRKAVALVHMLGYSRVFDKVCREMGVPHVATFSFHQETSLCSAGDDSLVTKSCTLVQTDTLREAKQWGCRLGSHWFCARESIPESFFYLGFHRLYGNVNPPQASLPIKLCVVGALKPDHHQLEIIHATSSLLKRGYALQLLLLGESTTDPDYFSSCQRTVRELDLEGQIKFKDSLEDPQDVYLQMDILVDAAWREGIPQAIREAAASGVLIVTTSAEGLCELVKDGIHGLLMHGSDPDQIAQTLSRALGLPVAEALWIRRNAYSMARQNFHLRKGLTDLLTMYNLAIKISSVAMPGPMLPKTEVGSGDLQATHPLPPPRSHVRLIRGLTYRVTPQQPQLSGLDVLVGTHQRSAKGTLRLQVRSEADELLREVSTDLNQIRDNDWVEFRFKPISNACGQTFILYFTLKATKRKTRLSLFEENPPEGKLRHLLRRLGVSIPGNSLYCRLWYTEKS